MKFAAIVSSAVFVVSCSGGGAGTESDSDETASTIDGHVARANGTMGAWQALAPMPTPRANHCSVTIGKWLLVIGGNHRGDDGSFHSTDEIHAARIQSDGTLGAWTLAGHTPSPVFECVATKRGSTLYVLDGIYDDPSKGAQVWSADFGSSGALGAWTSLGPLPPDVRVLYSAAWVKGTTLFAMQAKLPAAGDAVSTLRADVSNGLAGWLEDDWISGFRGHPQYAFTGTYLYTLGGYGGADNAVESSVFGANLEHDGSIGPAFSTSAMAAPTAFGAVVAVDDYLLSIGGKPQIYTAGVVGTATAHIGRYGRLDAWQAATPLPEGRTNHTAVLSGNYVFVAGGGFDGPGLDTVFSAQVRF
jgi:hypothetical protein